MGSGSAVSRLGDSFVLVRELWSVGGMARVFLGRDEVLERPVAVKVLETGLKTRRSPLFRCEDCIAARLSQPNIT